MATEPVAYTIITSRTRKDETTGEVRLRYTFKAVQGSKVRYYPSRLQIFSGYSEAGDFLTNVDAGEQKP